ncbi:UNVERIFIED_CONTAM: hypothetical protein Scaly_0967900 [Sesamum calycinum]|uniref:Uncharacterized protein n=1 Tax=Sesamum calycinum TaxID=2727403 RepID=A0AAW2QZF7_9LAMI
MKLVAHLLEINMHIWFQVLMGLIPMPLYCHSSLFFHPAGLSNAHEHVGYNSSRPVEYGKGDGYTTPQALQHRQPFLPGNAPFVQRPLHPEPPPQQTTGQFSYPNSVQQHQYPPYSLPNMSDGPRRYAADVQWRMPANELNADCQRGGWMTGGRSCSGPPYSHEGYFGPPPDRPPPGAISFAPSTTNSQPAATPVPDQTCLLSIGGQHKSLSETYRICGELLVFLLSVTSVGANSSSANPFVEKLFNIIDNFFNLLDVNCT